MAGSRKNVLWVDDEIEYLRSHIMFLETRGYAVVPVFSGDEAIQMIRESPRRFDIVLLDEQMPGKDGLTTLEEIKTMLPELPVVMVTKSEEEQLMEDALGRKIDGYLTKPVNPSQILSVCKAILDSPRLISTQVTQRFVRDYSENRAMLSREMSANDWIRLSTNLSSWDLEIEKTEDEGLRQNQAGQKSDSNLAFARYVAEHYPRWLVGEKRPPVLSPAVIPEFVAPLLNDGAKVRLVILDCLRLDQYLAVESLLKRSFGVEQHAFFSILPTAPEYSRTSLLSGLHPDEIAERTPEAFEPGVDVASFDRQLLEEQFSDLGLRFGYDAEYVRVRNAVEASELIEQSGKYEKLRFLTVAVDFFQMLTQGKAAPSLLQEIAGDESSLRALTLSWFQFSPILQLLRGLGGGGSVVILTSDHGSVLCNRGIELYGAQGLPWRDRYQFGERVTSDERHCLFIPSPPQYRLPAATPATACLLSTSNFSFIQPGDIGNRPAQTRNGFHYGGISLEEMIVPLAVLTSKES